MYALLPPQPPSAAVGFLLPLLTLLLFLPFVLLHLREPYISSPEKEEEEEEGGRLGKFTSLHHPPPLSPGMRRKEEKKANKGGWGKRPRNKQLYRGKRGEAGQMILFLSFALCRRGYCQALFLREML